ncbi:hypothetical protein P7C70_g8758, partial [Phenoliferia sp. Uapishka_3]
MIATSLFPSPAGLDSLITIQEKDEAFEPSKSPTLDPALYSFTLPDTPPTSATSEFFPESLNTNNLRRTSASFQTHRRSLPSLHLDIISANPSGTTWSPPSRGVRSWNDALARTLGISPRAKPFRVILLITCFLLFANLVFNHVVLYTLYHHESELIVSYVHTVSVPYYDHLKAMAEATKTAAWR